jgi:hypothetical protein
MGVCIVDVQRLVLAEGFVLWIAEVLVGLHNCKMLTVKYAIRDGAEWNQRENEGLRRCKTEGRKVETINWRKGRVVRYICIQ